MAWLEPKKEVRNEIRSSEKKNVKGGEIKIDLLKKRKRERERERERERIMVEMETERFLRQIKRRQSGQRACVKDGDGKRKID